MSSQGSGTRPLRLPWRQRLRIAVDMDEVIADSDGKHLRVYNQMFNESLTIRDLAGRPIEEVVPQDRVEAVQSLLLDPTFYTDLELIEGSQAGVRALSERYEVFIATAAMEVPTAFAAKFAWLRRHFPFVPPSHIVFCGDKSVLDVDYLIDDSPRHFQHFRGKPILFTSAHNLGEQRYFRVHGWEDVREAFLSRDTGAAPRADRVIAILASDSVP